MRKIIFSIFFLLLLPIPLLAADLQTSVSVSKNKLMPEESLTLTVTLKGPGVERIHLPDLFPPAFTVIEKSDKPSLSQDAYGHPVSGRILRYKLQPTSPGRFRVGAFSLSYGGTTYRVAGELVEVQGPSPGPKQRPSAGVELETEPSAPIDVRLSAEVDRGRVYVGEKIVLSIRITHNSSEVDDIKLVDLPQFASFWNKEILLTHHVNPAREIRINGRPYVTQLIPRFVLYPATSGRLTIPPLTYSMVAHGRAGRVSSETKSLLLKTAPINVEVLTLPDTDRPAEFRGAVGRYKFRAELKDRVTRVGTPARLVLEIEAEGNLDALTPPPLPPLSGAKVYDLSRVQVKGGEEQTPPIARWEADIVPTVEGQLTIPPISFAYFDPASRSYQVAKSELLQLEVAAAEIKSPVVSQPSFLERLSLLLASRRARYSLLAFLLLAGLGLAFILVRRQRVREVVVAAEPEPNPAIQEIRKLVNSSYGKLHRGDERAYASDLLRAMRLIFESGFGVSSSELTVEKIGELLRTRGADDLLCHGAVDLYQECERICFSPDKAGPLRDQDFARFNEARGIIFNLLEFVGDKA